MENLILHYHQNVSNIHLVISIIILTLFIIIIAITFGEKK